MTCKQCGETFPKNQPYDLFELRRNRVLPADPEGMTSTVIIEDGGMFCSRKCLGDHLRVGERSGMFDLGNLRKKIDEQR